MRTLDDIFHKEERDYSDLKKTEEQLIKVTLIIGAINLLCWLVVGLLDPDEGIDLLFGVAILFTIFPPIICLILALPVAAIPYKDFDYRERFPRAWLLVMIVFLSAMTVLGFFALVMDNFNF